MESSAPNPYTMTGDDATGQAGLLQILQRIQEAQNRPLIPDNPLSQLGAAMQGFSAGYAGQQNPAIVQAMQERQQALSGLTQTGALMQHMATMAQTERLRKVQEASEARKDQLERLKFKSQLATERIKDPNPSVRAGGYRELQMLPPEYGGIDPKANPEELAANTKEKFDQLHDEAVALLAAGHDPESPAWRGRFAGVPISEYKATIAADPLAAWGLFKKRPTYDEFTKMLKTSFSAIPEGQRSEVQQRVLAAMMEQAPVNYGSDFYRVGADLSGSDPAFGPWNPKAPRPDQAKKINAVIEENKRPSIERLTGRAAQEPDPAKRQAILAQRDELVEQYAKIQGAKTSATVAASPLQEADRKDIQAFSSAINQVEQLSQFTPEEITRYTGVLNNPLAKAKRAARAIVNQSTEDNRRFSEFQALMGQFQRGLFEEGGKQLTQMEARIARMSRPTGTEAGGATEMLAKAKYLAAFMAASRAARIALAKTGKADLDPDILDGMIMAQLERRGIRLPSERDPAPWNPAKEIPPPPKDRWRLVPSR